MRPLEELVSSGILWLINRVVFHPRGYAFALHFDDNKKVVGWEILGNGREVFVMDHDLEDEKFALAETTLREISK